jgi:hypothetical protein
MIGCFAKRQPKVTDLIGPRPDSIQGYAYMDDLSGLPTQTVGADEAARVVEEIAMIQKRHAWTKISDRHAPPGTIRKAPQP